MAQINLKLDEDQLARTDYLAGEVHRTRTSYIREAITEYNTRTERELLAARLLEVSARVRDESLAVSCEIEPADSALPQPNH
jgi:predicted DNA-binding protein